MRYLAPWMFKDCSFRLRTFFVAGWIIANLTEDEWLRFLGQQRKIERCDMRWMFLLPNIRWWTDVFSQRSGNQDGSLQILPYLSTAKIQDWNMLQLLYPRALVHLQLTVGPDSMTRSSIDMFATNLKAVQTTLTHISFHMRNYSWEVPDDWSVANVLAVIAKSTLGLKFLEFSAVKEPVSDFCVLLTVTRLNAHSSTDVVVYAHTAGCILVAVSSLTVPLHSPVVGQHATFLGSEFTRSVLYCCRASHAGLSIACSTVIPSQGCMDQTAVCIRTFWAVPMLPAATPER